MKADQLKPILQHYSHITAGAGASDAGELGAFAVRLGEIGPQTLKKILNAKSIAKARERLKREDYKRDGVSQHIQSLACLLELAGLKSSAEVSELARVIEEELWGSSDALIAVITMPKSVSSAPQPVRLDVVRTYSDELARLEHDNNAFDHLIARIKSDRNVRKQEMQEIACRFFGYRVTPASKEKLLQKIVDLQAKDARQQARTQQ
jgi:hypothetical protein